MTNEEAFEKWAIDYGLDYEPSFTRYDVEAAWNAAIAYMQEQNKSAEQSEPVATIHRGIAYWIGKEPPEGTNLYTSAQQKEWVSLHDDDINELSDKAYKNGGWDIEFARYIEAKLKELNT